MAEREHLVTYLFKKKDVSTFGNAESCILHCTCLKFPDFDNQTNDDDNEDNNQTTHNHIRQLCDSIKRFYKRSNES